MEINIIEKSVNILFPEDVLSVSFLGRLIMGAYSCLTVKN